MNNKKNERSMMFGRRPASAAKKMPSYGQKRSPAFGGGMPSFQSPMPDAFEEPEEFEEDTEELLPEEFAPPKPQAPRSAGLKHVWKWNGHYFGYFDGDDLWTAAGKHVGRKENDEIFDLKGKYIGEIQQQDRLICDKRKVKLKRHVSRSFPMLASRASVPSMGNKSACALKPNFEDFLMSV